ncbi:hypothetical protein MTO96_045623 [Rhipicephalus appendiculatus]
MQHPRLSAQAWETQEGGYLMLSEVSVNEAQINESLILTNDLPIPPPPPPEDIASDFGEVNEAMTTSMAEVIVSRGLAMRPKNVSHDTASDSWWHDLIALNSRGIYSRPAACRIPWCTGPMAELPEHKSSGAPALIMAGTEYDVAADADCVTRACVYH